MIKKVILSVSTVISINISDAQIQVGKGMGVGGIYSNVKKNITEEVELFKKSTLIITIPNKDSVDIAKYKEELAKVWKITPFEVVTIDRIKEYSNKPNYSFATIGGVAFNIGAGNDKFGASRAVGSFQYQYEIWMPVPNKLMNVNERYLFAKILLQPDMNTKVKGPRTDDPAAWARIRTGIGPAVRLYETGHFHNFGYGFLKCFFKVINDGLTDFKTLSIYNMKISEENSNRLQKLKSDTLYVLKVAQNPEYTIEPVSKSVNEKQGVKNEPEMKDQNIEDEFVVRFIDESDLNEKIRSATKPIYYLNLLETSWSNFSNVFDGLTGDILYQRSDDFFSADKNYHFYLKKIAKEIK